VISVKSEPSRLPAISPTSRKPGPDGRRDPAEIVTFPLGRAGTAHPGRKLAKPQTPASPEIRPCNRHPDGCVRSAATAGNRQASSICLACRLAAADPAVPAGRLQKQVGLLAPRSRTSGSPGASSRRPGTARSGPCWRAAEAADRLHVQEAASPPPETLTHAGIPSRGRHDLRQFHRLIAGRFRTKAPNPAAADPADAGSRRIKERRKPSQPVIHELSSMNKDDGVRSAGDNQGRGHDRFGFCKRHALQRRRRRPRLRVRIHVVIKEGVDADIPLAALKGGAIRLPKPPSGILSCLGKNRSQEPKPISGCRATAPASR